MSFLGLGSVVLGGLAVLLIFLAVTSDDMGEGIIAARPTASARPAGPTPNPALAVGPGRQATPEAGAAPIVRPSSVPPPGGVPTPGPTIDPSAEAAAVQATEDLRVTQALQGLMTDEDRVGQLLLVGWIGDRAEDARETIRQLRPGGIVHVANARSRVAGTTINARLPEVAAEHGVLTPLIAVDHEGGEVQRIGDIANLGTNWDFGRQQPTDRQACERGQTHARQLRSMGFTMNLAPVLDVNNNPNNPVIGNRSYGDDPELVARLGSAYVRGLQGGGVAAVGKHFPGHGNTGVDSHLDLPVLPLAEEALERVELVPFRRAIAPDTDIVGIMSAHIVFPALDPTRTPSTLSRPIMTGLLRERLGFRGLVVSDDMGAMKAITDNYGPGEAAVRAVRAGVDLLIIGGDLQRQQASRDALLTALAAGELGRDRVDEAVRHVLRVKARLALLGGPAAPEAGCVG